MSIGKYKKVKKLGSGSSGTVWLCTSEDGLEVAIKLFNPDILEDENALILDMFSNEIELAEQLKHPNIVNLMGHHISDDAVFIVMEYIDGGSLEQFCATDSLLPLNELVNYAIAIAEALNHASKNNVIHCDLKPSNVFITKDKVIKLSDFGAGMRIVNGVAMPDTLIGSPAYMSPEYIQGENIAVTSDIYSFGMMLYKLATGRLPFFTSNEKELLWKIVTVEPPRPSLFRTSIPSKLESIILKCLRKNQKDRFRTWAEVSSALTSTIKDLAVTDKASASMVHKKLYEHTFFSGLSTESLWEIANSSSFYVKNDNSVIVEFGEKNTDIFFIVSGVVTEKDYGGTPINISIAGEVVGEDGYMKQLAETSVGRSTSLVVAKKSEIIVIHPDSISMMSDKCRLEFITAFCRWFAKKHIFATKGNSLKNMSQGRKEMIEQRLVA